MLFVIGLPPKFAKLSKILWKIWKFWKRILVDQIHSGGEGQSWIHAGRRTKFAPVKSLDTSEFAWGFSDLKTLFCFNLSMVSACYCRGRLCFGRGRDRSFVLYISLFLRALGWCVCVCLYTCVHTHKLLGYLMWAQVWDRHLESQKNPDRLKRRIHVDSIGVHSTFVYIYAVLRVLMIWANCLFLLTCLFFLEK